MFSMPLKESPCVAFVDGNLHLWVCHPWHRCKLHPSEPWLQTGEGTSLQLMRSGSGGRQRQSSLGWVKYNETANFSPSLLVLWIFPVSLQPWQRGRRASGLEWEQGTKCKNGLRQLTYQTSWCLERSLDDRISHPADLPGGERFGTVKSGLMCWKSNCLNVVDRRPLRELS